MSRTAPAHQALALIMPAALALIASLALAVRADEPNSLHERIDALLDSGAAGPIAPACNDADFLRRASLDIIGVIPTASEVRAFLADSAPDKRVKLIDRLLASPDYCRHFSLVLDAELMERRSDKAVKTPEWQKYLFESIRANKPLDQLYREIVAADGVDPNLRPAARYLLDRDCEVNVVTRDLGRNLFGMDLQCAQCHDHPLVDDYLQEDYYGLQAFLVRSSVFTDAKAKLTQVQEKAEGEVGFKSVFTKKGQDKAIAQVPKWISLVEPPAVKGQEYVTAPAKDVRGVPKFSRRAALAEMLSSSDPFRRNLANRIWAYLFGRGLVHPLDGHHAGNPPTNPALLVLLADELVARKFDLRVILRELLLTRAYARSCEPPKPEAIEIAKIEADLTKLEGEIAAATAKKETLKADWKKALAESTAARDQGAAASTQRGPLEAALQTARDAAKKATDEVAAAQKTLSGKKEILAAVNEAVAKTQAAVAKIPDDKILAEAGAKLAERAKAIDAEVQAAAKLAAEKEGASAAANLLVAASERKLQELSSPGATPERRRELELAERAAYRIQLDAHFAIADLESRRELLRQVKQYVELTKTDAKSAEQKWPALVEAWTNRGQVARLKPLSSEQFFRSWLQASGVAERDRTSAEDALKKSPPDEWKNAAAPEQPAVMARLVEAKAFESTRGPLSIFVGLYGGLPGQDFQATVNQALFLGNDGLTFAWLAPVAGGLTDRAVKLKEAPAVADELCFAIFGRPASDADKEAVAKYLEGRNADRLLAIQEMAWAWLASSEFRFNH